MLYANSATKCTAPELTGTYPLDQMQQVFEFDRCAQSQTLYDVTAAQHRFAPLQARASGLGTGIVQAQSSADNRLSTAAARLRSSLPSAGAAQLRTGKAALQTGSRALANGNRDAVAAIDASTSQLIKQLGHDVDAANSQEATSSRTLTADVDAVLLALGTVHGHGILGGVYGSATSVGIGAGTIGNATEQSSNYKGVRLAQIAASSLAAQQQQAGLELVSTFRPFGERLPNGSTVASAFAFTLGPVR